VGDTEAEGGAVPLLLLLLLLVAAGPATVMVMVGMGGALSGAGWVDSDKAPDSCWSPVMVRRRSVCEILLGVSLSLCVCVCVCVMDRPSDTY
jgi:hypothetical protein